MSVITFSYDTNKPLFDGLVNVPRGTPEAPPVGVMGRPPPGSTGSGLAKFL